VTSIINLFTVRACALIVRRPVKTRASRLWRALTGRQGTGTTPRYSARHQQREEPVCHNTDRHTP